MPRHRRNPPQRLREWIEPTSANDVNGHAALRRTHNRAVRVRQCRASLRAAAELRACSRERASARSLATCNMQHSATGWYSTRVHHKKRSRAAKMEGALGYSGAVLRVLSRAMPAGRQGTERRGVHQLAAARARVGLRRQSRQAARRYTGKSARVLSIPQYLLVGLRTPTSPTHSTC